MILLEITGFFIVGDPIQDRPLLFQLSLVVDFEIVCSLWFAGSSVHSLRYMSVPQTIDSGSVRNYNGCVRASSGFWLGWVYAGKRDFRENSR